ncbi:SCO family protein [Rhodovulum tesquicola]|uniref:SCO family protein n=1 Tax=Rhodovulum tesquicola TaxID=540254 RepID=UPI0020985D45|nr:SCO family protein [Rhodovulum tesquicola]MCO8143768.1 SCO family protein [Rhodovulum tesquicola]
MNRTALAGIVLMIAALVGGGLYLLQMGPADDRFAQCRSGRIGGDPAQLGGPFTLIDETGATVTDRDVITGPTLIYFGYSFCPDVCPLDNARNAEAVHLLDARGYQVLPVFISIDPGRDTPELLAEFTGYMHPRMLGLTGTAEQVRAASRAYRTFYSVQDTEDPYYLIDHSTFTYLAFPGLGVVEVFGRDMTPEEMADRVACFADSFRVKLTHPR